jgi:glycosyltransferase involved in cell wall biosynthesis
MSDRMRLLVIAYHFPPIQGSSGYLRTLKFVSYLPSFGIDPTVLTVNTRAYEATDPGLLGQIPANVEVHRSFALDAKRHLAYKGRYLSAFGIPDRYSTWIPFAILDGLRLIRSRKIDAIFSTYPIPSAHSIGRALARLSGKPWLADFRDPMWDEYVDVPPGELRARQRIERASLEACAHATVTTSGMKELYRTRYPGIAQDKITVIPNGYDERDFAGVAPQPRSPGDPVTFVHAGLLDPIDRNPEAFFKAVKLAVESGRLGGKPFVVDFYTPGKIQGLQEELRKMGIPDSVRILPAVPYKQALQAMARADVLLLFQGPSCDNQIPAKLYEYLRIGKPILALTTEKGETGRLIAATGGGIIVPIDDVSQISQALGRCVEASVAGLKLPCASLETASSFSRQNQAKVLAERLAAFSRRS